MDDEGPWLEARKDRFPKREILIEAEHLPIISRTPMPSFASVRPCSIALAVMSRIVVDEADGWVAGPNRRGAKNDETPSECKVQLRIH